MEEWTTRITSVEPDRLLISGYLLEELAAKKGLLETAHVLVTGDLPSQSALKDLEDALSSAIGLPPPNAVHVWGDDVSKTMAKSLLMDQNFPSKMEPHVQTAFCIGRMLCYIANVNNNTLEDEGIHTIMESAFGGRKGSGRLMEAMAVACVDHGVTPPSAQATLVLASTRASYEVSVAGGISAITDVHGGAGAKAAAFFHDVVSAARDGQDIEKALVDAVKNSTDSKKRIPGLGHRVHRNDPRRDVLWRIAGETGIAGVHADASKRITNIFSRETGKTLPINVDGVIGALVADMGLDFMHAKTLFILGRTAGLSAHYYEENTRLAMRRLDFAKCSYSGEAQRPVP